MSLNLEPLRRLSVCPCGFPTLAESIELGQLYWIDRTRLLPFIFKCGGCGEVYNLTCVYVAGRDISAPPGYLPLDIFEPPAKVRN
jgi:hypothetical protein